MKRIHITHSGKVILILPFFILACVLSPQSQAQIHEIGVSGGALNYSGDLVPMYHPGDFRPAGHAFYRFNKSTATSFRLGALFGQVAGSDQRPVDPFAENRQLAFRRLLFEAEALVEYHFLDYKNPKSLIRWSPYFFTGVGGAYLFGPRVASDGSTYSPVQVVLPLGMGVKYQVTPKFSMNVEAGARLMFTDYLDNVSRGNLDNKNYLYGQWNTNDIYYYTGISFCYTFYTIHCPYEFQ